MWPFDELGGIFDDSITFQEIKPFEAQGEFREVSLILVLRFNFTYGYTSYNEFSCTFMSWLL